MTDSNSTQSDLSKFNLKEILGNYSLSKKVCLLGAFGEEDAIVLLEKTPFSDADFPGILQVSKPPDIYLKNDVFLSLCHFPPLNFSGFKTTVICPASEELIKKYTPAANCIIEETYESYVSITKPYIQENLFKSIQWVYNILEHQAETERIIFEDPDQSTGFILLPDLKWDGINKEAFYVQALPHIRGLQTIRDLTADHLPLLRKIAEKTPKLIEEKYNIPKSQILAYFHYLPSYYHIHIHFKLINSEGNAGSGCERAHLLSSVIQNLEIASDYYQKVALPISLKNTSELVEKLGNYGTVNTSGSTTST